MAYVVVRPQAERDLIELWRYIAEESTPARADAFLDKLLDKVDVLAGQPGIGRPRDELKPGLRSHPVERYLIFYFQIDEGIELVRILHGRRDVDTAFLDEEE